MRTKKAILNFIFDALPQFIISLLGFLRFKLILSNIGEDVLGVYQLFGQLVAYITFVDFGLTSAVCYSLYAPIANNDKEKINRILSGAKYVFNIITIIMFIVGISLTLGIGFFIKETSLSLGFIQICFFLMVISNVITYFVASHTILFDAEQNKYQYIRYTQILLFIKAILEIVFIIIFKNILSILILGVFVSIIQNIIIVSISKRKHKNLNFKCEKDLSFWQKTKELIPHKIGTLVANNIDVLIISKFIGLAQVVTYTSYMYIINTLVTIFSKLSTASSAGIGNLLVVDKGKAYDKFLEYNSFVFFLATIICVPLYFAISPFVSLFYGESYVVGTITCLLFVFLVFYSIIRTIFNTFVTAAGLFKETIICVFLEIAINLTLSLVLIKYIGITGVILATAIAYILSEYVLKPSILNKHIFHNKILVYYKDCLFYIIIVIINLYLINISKDILVVSNFFNWLLFSGIIFVLNFIVTVIYYKIIKKLSFIDRLIPNKLKGKIRV